MQLLLLSHRNVKQILTYCAERLSPRIRCSLSKLVYNGIDFWKPKKQKKPQTLANAKKCITQISLITFILQLFLVVVFAFYFCFSTETPSSVVFWLYNGCSYHQFKYNRYHFKKITALWNLSFWKIYIRTSSAEGSARLLGSLSSRSHRKWWKRDCS